METVVFCITRVTIKKSKKNSVVLIDAGCEYQNYASDITRTFPANGRFSEEQRAIYEIVLAAQLAGIKAVRPGAPWSAAQTAIIKVITQGLLDLGILKGKLNTLIEKEAYFPFYMHKSGHWLGMDVHDVGRSKLDGKPRAFQENMVITVEPGIYIPLNDGDAPKDLRGIGVRIEDDVLIKAQKPVVLTEIATK